MSPPNGKSGESCKTGTGALQVSSAVLAANRGYFTPVPVFVTKFQAIAGIL
jgi:hypothetical protein